MSGGLRWRLAPLVLIAVLATMLAACSGVPQSSDPQVVKSIGGEASTPAAPSTPPPGADGRTIVNLFLTNNVSADVRHTNARQYLTADAQKRWQDTSATIVANDVNTSLADPLTGDVVVNAKRIGAVAADGIYTPSLRDPSSASSAEAVTFTFTVVRVDGQWRIDQLPNGLIISQKDFEDSYSQFPVYFFDSTEQVLVADLRYTATNGQSLATFLLTQLIAGPRSELSAMINEVPDQPATSNPTVTVGPITDIDLASVNKLPPATLTKLAVQLAFTLSSKSLDKPAQRTGIQDMRIVESGAPVVIPGRSVTFNPQEFPDYRAPSQIGPDVLFIRGAGVYSSGTDKALTSPAGSGELNLAAATQAHGSQGAPGALAAVGVTPAGEQLYVGADAQSLAPIPAVVAPHLTRPTWAAAWNELWISDGARLWRVSNGGTVSAVSMTARPGNVQGTIVSARMSRDGSRLAVIYDIAGSGRAVWVGTVVRGAGDARVEQLTQITPAGFGRLDDLAWSDEGSLYVAGLQASGDYGVWSVKVDGSMLMQRTAPGLPSASGDTRPLTVTAGPGRLPWVSVAGTMWELGAQWTPAMSDPFGPTTATQGASPAYQD